MEHKTGDGGEVDLLLQYIHNLAEIKAREIAWVGGEPHKYEKGDSAKAEMAKLDTLYNKIKEYQDNHPKTLCNVIRKVVYGRS